MRKTLIHIAFLFLPLLMTAQEYEFSQYYTASLYLNPAFAGIYTTPTLNANYRQESVNVELQRQQAQVSAVFPIITTGSEAKQFGGIGVSGYNITMGIKETEQVTGVNLTYAQTLNLGVVSPDVLAVGVQAGYETISSSFSSLRWGSQYSPYLFTGFDDTAPDPVNDYDTRTSHLIVNAGIMYYYNRNRNYLLYNYSAFSGISVSNANRPDKSLNRDGEFKSPLLYKYHGAFEFNFNRIFVIPTAMVQMYANNFQYNIGSYITYATNASRGFSLDNRGLELVAGAWYRVRDSFIVILGISHDNYAVNVSYDFNSTLFYPEQIQQNQLQNAAFEISIKYTRNKSSKLRKVSNPLF